jgi:DNA-directed RNA polymerase subunit beta'
MVNPLIKEVICKWDPYNGVIVSEFTGKIAYED